MSRAILKVTESGITKDIEKRLFGTETNYSNTQISSNSLSLESFWGLFLIAGLASLSALIIFAAMFLYKQREIFMSSDLRPTDSKWERVRQMLKIYDHKDLSSHTFKKNRTQANDGRGAGDHDNNVDGMGDVVVFEGSPNTNSYPSPSTYSIHTDSELGFLGEQDTPSREFDFPNQAPSHSTIELTFANQESAR